jgi:hypothetical protein
MKQEELEFYVKYEEYFDEVFEEIKEVISFEIEDYDDENEENHEMPPCITVVNDFLEPTIYRKQFLRCMMSSLGKLKAKLNVLDYDEKKYFLEHIMINLNGIIDEMLIIEDEVKNNIITKKAYFRVHLDDDYNALNDSQKLPLVRNFERSIKFRQKADRAPEFAMAFWEMMKQLIDEVDEIKSDIELQRRSKLAESENLSFEKFDTDLNLSLVVYLFQCLMGNDRLFKSKSNEQIFRFISNNFNFRQGKGDLKQIHNRYYELNKKSIEKYKTYYFWKEEFKKLSDKAQKDLDSV